MKKAKILISIFIILITINSQYSYALEQPTHMNINKHIATNSMNGFSFDMYLKNILGFQKGKDEELINKKAFEWLGYGGQKEDEPLFRTPNHFHNPITDEGFSGIWSSGFFSGHSALYWSQLEKDTQNPGGYYSWHDVRNYFYNALTGSSAGVRETYFAETFRGVGQLMHLVQDMSVPEHARNDGHYLAQIGLVFYEQWVKKKYSSSVVANVIPISPDQSILSNINQLAEVPIANLFDTDQYDGTNPGITKNNQTIGLSEYTNANYLSPDTMFSVFPFPSLQNVVLYRDAGQLYFKTAGNGENINHLARAGVLDMFKDHYIPEYSEQPIASLDIKCYEEYASKLIPRAMGYSARLLEYFFRGKIDLVIDGYQKYHIKNNTDEEMTGTFELYYDHIIGSRLIVPNSPFPLQITIPANGTSGNITFPFPSNAKEPGKYVLVFRGSMGNENDAVVGKVVSFTSMIAFHSQPGGFGESNIAIISSDGTGERQITNNSDGLPYKFSPAWSSDSTKLAFEANSDTSNYDIIVLDMTSKSEYPGNILFRFDTGYDEYNPSFSPDGKKIAAIKYRAGGNDEMIIFNLETGTWNSIGEVGESYSAFSPQWAPHGDKIAYHSYPSGITKFDISLIDAATGVSENITNSVNYHDMDPAWSPDGRYIAFCSNRDGGIYRDLWLYDTNTMQYFQLIEDQTNCHSPSFSPDGNSIIFSAYHIMPDNSIRYYGMFFLNDIYEGNAGIKILKEIEPGVLESTPAWSSTFNPPVIDVFEAEPITIHSGNATTLSWKTSNTLSCRIETDFGQELECNSTNGSLNVNPSETTTYTITAYGKAGSRVSMNATVTVTQ